MRSSEHQAIALWIGAILRFSVKEGLCDLVWLYNCFSTIKAVVLHEVIRPLESAIVLAREAVDFLEHKNIIQSKCVGMALSLQFLESTVVSFLESLISIEAVMKDCSKVIINAESNLLTGLLRELLSILEKGVETSIVPALDRVIYLGSFHLLEPLTD